MQLSEKMGFDPETKIELSFMNYGNTELVYLASIGDKIKVATLINQPHTPLGKVQEEFINLQRLREIDPTHVINPLVYFKKEDKQHEIYAAEYIDNALCIAHNNGHGIYNPLPKYHFENFSPNISREININMIALLVNYYDQEKNR